LDPVYTIPYGEFCVAQQLSRLLPRTGGYSLYAPISQQEPGVDLIVARRAAGRTRVATVQVKTSRTYSHAGVTARTKRHFRYKTWFNTFDCPPEADFFCLVALYPAVDAAEKRELGSWWAPQILLFSQVEMRRFLRSVRTVRGHPDRMFGFGFNTPQEAFQTRGDPKRRFRPFSRHLLTGRLTILARYLGER
jgi:hypothetical protein